MNYIKQNHLSILIILWLAVTALMGSDVSFGANRETSTITNPFNFTQGLTATNLTVSAGSVAVTGTATTTLSLKSTSATKGACIPFNATSTNTLLNMSFGATSSATTVGVEPIIRYGDCN